MFQHIRQCQCIPLLCFNRPLLFQSLTVIMITWEDLSVIRMCIEWFLHGKIFVLCALTVTCILAKEVQLFPGLGIYSGIFVIYLQCRSPESRTTNIVFYALSLLYILSTATIVSDLLSYIIGVSNNSISKNIIFLSVMQLYINDTTLPVQLQLDLQSMLFRVTIVQTTLNGCCDFIAQCTLVCINHCTHVFYSPKSSKIYRCWIVWGKNTRVVIIPSFLAITYIGQLNTISSFDKPISIYRI